MRATGLARRLDGLGRVVIPRPLREKFNIEEGDVLDFLVDENGIYIKLLAKATEEEKDNE